MRLFTTSSTTTGIPFTSASDVSISLDRYSTWGDRPAPSSGNRTAAPRTTTSSSSGIAWAMAGLRWGRPGKAECPSSTRFHIQTATNPNTRAIRPSRR